MKHVEFLVLGGAGMLGHKVLQHLLDRGDDVGATVRDTASNAALLAPELFKAVPTIVDQFDVADSDRALQRVAELRPRVIINCIGIVKQRSIAKEFVPSIVVNSLWPHLLADAAGTWGGRVIHISTDCVFSGARGAYNEADSPDATDVYGRTKALGELDQTNSLTVRTSIIGRELQHFSSLLEWFIARRGSRVGGFTRAWFSGVTTNCLARVVRNLIYGWPSLHGLYHLAGPRISKHDLLCVINRELRLGIEIVPEDVFFCDRSLDGTRFHNATGFTPPTWDEMIGELANDTTPYSKWRD